jgi:Family of unknown function (DUF5692)
MEIEINNLFLYTALLFVVLVGLGELLRRSKLTVYVLFAVLPLMLIPYWHLYGDMDLFKWVKNFSIFGAIFWMTLIRLTKLKNEKWTYTLMYVFVGVNIIEAVLWDMKTIDIPSILNIISGLGLIFFLRDIKSAKVDKKKPHDLLSPNLNFHWVIWYTVWNWLFIYMAYPYSSFRHIGVLGAALVLSLLTKDTWLQARAYTLGLYLFFRATFIEAASTTDIISRTDSNVALVISILSFSLMAGYALNYYKPQLLKLIKK